MEIRCSDPEVIGSFRRAVVNLEGKKEIRLRDSDFAREIYRMRDQNR